MTGKIVRKSLFKNKPMLLRVGVIFMMSVIITSIAILVTGTMYNSYNDYKKK